MENNSLTDIVKSRREAGEGVFSSLGGAAKERLKEKLDFKRILPQGGLLTALFPKLKAYKAQKAASPGDRVLKNIDTDFKLFAKNSEKLENIAINLLLMKREINKLAKLEKVSPATVADKSIRSISQSDTSSPAKMETEKENSMFLLIAAVAAVGVAMTLGYKKLEESFDLSISGALKSLSNLGGDLYDKLKSSFETLDFKKLIFDSKDEIEKEVVDSFNRNKNSLLNKKFAKEVQDSLDIDVAAEEDADLGAAMKANIEARNPMNYAQDGPSTNTGPTTPTRSPPNRRPGENIVSSSYGNRTNPVTGQQQLHGGIDIKGQTGDPIYSTGKGKAFIGKPNSGFGTWVIIDHGNGLQTYYGHMSSHLITDGESVEAGTLIGLVGSTGISTGPHLHYQIMKDGKPVDPENNNPSQLKDYSFAKYGLLAIPEKPANQSSPVTPSTSPTNVSSPSQMGTIDPSKTTFNDLTKEQQDIFMQKQRESEGFKPGSLTYDLNNPGAMLYSSWQKSFGGELDTTGRGVGTVKGKFARFPTLEDGVNAQRALLSGTNGAPKIYVGLPLEQAINQWVTGNKLSNVDTNMGATNTGYKNKIYEALIAGSRPAPNSSAQVVAPAQTNTGSPVAAPAARADKTTPAGSKSASVDLLPFLLNRQYV